MGAASQQTTKKSLKLSYEEYKAMAIMIVHYLRKKDTENAGDVTKKDVVAWYIEEVTNDIESQDEIVEKKQIVEKVLDKLAYEDNVLVPLNSKGLKTATTEEGDTTDNPILIVHPNYVEDE